MEKQKCFDNLLIFRNSYGFATVLLQKDSRKVEILIFSCNQEKSAQHVFQV